MEWQVFRRKQARGQAVSCDESRILEFMTFNVGKCKKACPDGFGAQLVPSFKTVDFTWDARLPARAADEIEDDLGGLGEVGVRGELNVPLSFIRGVQEGVAVAALERDAAMALVLRSEKGKSREKKLRTRSDAALRSPDGMIPGYSLRGDVEQIFGDDQVLKFVGLGLSFGVIEVYIEGVALGDGSGSSASSDNSESDDSDRDSELEQDPRTLSLSDDDYIFGGGNEDLFVARRIGRDVDVATAIIDVVAQLSC
ncbi:hypothetical protein NL676_032122 [Syzygium grande]|nr:hypothetical protein NL676_032122 [Syzygium grande]